MAKIYSDFTIPPSSFCARKVSTFLNEKRLCYDKPTVFISGPALLLNQVKNFQVSGLEIPQKDDRQINVNGAGTRTVSIPEQYRHTMNIGPEVGKHAIKIK